MTAVSPGRTPLHRPLGRHLGDGFVLGAELAERRHVGGSAVGEFGRHVQVGGSPGVVKSFSRGITSSRPTAPLPGSASRAPAPPTRAARGTATSRRRTAGRPRGRRWPVGFSSSRLRSGSCAVDSPAEAVARQGEVVLLRRVVAEQRQPQAALALERAVTGPGAAPRAHQQRRDVALEVHRGQFRPAGQAHRVGLRRGHGDHRQDKQRTTRRIGRASHRVLVSSCGSVTSSPARSRRPSSCPRPASPSPSRPCSLRRGR